jgi:cathepsin B
MAGQDNNIDYESLRENAKVAARKAGKKPTSSNSSSYLLISLGVLLSAIILSLLFASSDQPPHLVQVLDPSLIDSINNQKLSFTSKVNLYFKDWSLADVKQACQTGSSQQARNLPICQSFSSHPDMRRSFDLRDEFPSCILEPESQQNCSSSYSFAAANAAAERFCIKSGKTSPRLSSQQLVSCSKRNSKCSSGNIDSAWEYIRDSGLYENKHFLYLSEHSHVPECKEPSDQYLFKVKDVCASAGEEGIMKEIIENGPVVGLLNVFSDFLVYAHGIYQPSDGAIKIQGGQAVEIVGWGEDQGVKYWIVKNSWGNSWGENGYAMVARGCLKLGIEDLTVSATPVIQD